MPTLSSLTAKTSAGVGDLLYLLDVSDTSQSAQGTSKTLTIGNLFTNLTLTTPVLGVATATSINKVALTQPATAATLTILNNKTLTANNSLTLAGTDSTTITFQGTDTYVGRTTTDTLTNKTLTTPIINQVNTSASTAHLIGAALAPTVSALTDAATISTDASLGNVFTVTLGGNRNMGAPSNATNGQSITYIITQDGTGSRTITWNAIFNFGTAGAPTLTTTASKKDYVSFRYDSAATKWQYQGSTLGY